MGVERHIICCGDGVADGIAEWRNGGMADGMMAEWRNGGMAEWRNGGMAAKWQNG